MLAIQLKSSDHQWQLRIIAEARESNATRVSHEGNVDDGFPSGNQTWQWRIPHLYMIFLEKTLSSWGFSQPAAFDPTGNNHCPLRSRRCLYSRRGNHTPPKVKKLSSDVRKYLDVFGKHIIIRKCARNQRSRKPNWICSDL